MFKWSLARLNGIESTMMHLRRQFLKTLAVAPLAVTSTHLAEASPIKKGGTQFKFYSTGLVIIQNGWKNIYSFEEKNDEQKEDQDEQTLPFLQKDQVVGIESVTLKNDTTKPPKRLNE